MLESYPSIEPERIRDPIVSGIFYPEDPTELKNSVDAYLKNVGRIRMDALAVVSPHAGLPYSGSVQAKALSAARSRRIENVVILSPRHKPGDSLVYLPESDFFRTPSGRIRVAREFLSELESCGTAFSVDDIPHLEEHAVESQLPFVERLFPDASIVPLILGSSDRMIALSVSRALEFVFADRLETTLFVVSGNLSRGPDASAAMKSSIALIKRAEALDGDGLLSQAQGACGAHCLSALLACSFMRGRKMETLCLGDSSSAASKGDPGSDQGEPASAGEDTVVYAALAYY